MRRARFGLLTTLTTVALLLLPEAQAHAAGPQRGGGFDEGPYIWIAPGAFGLPVGTDDFLDLDPTFGWGFGGGWMFARGRVFKATVGGAFEHTLLFFEDSDLDFDEFGGHVLRFVPEARIGAGTDKVWGYGLVGGGVAGVLVHVRHDGPIFDLDEDRSAPGFSFQLGGGVQGIVYRNLFLGGEFDVDLGQFYEDDEDDFLFNDDDDFAIYQVTIEFLVGWYF